MKKDISFADHWHCSTRENYGHCISQKNLKENPKDLGHLVLVGSCINTALMEHGPAFNISGFSIYFQIVWFLFKNQLGRGFKKRYK